MKEIFKTFISLIILLILSTLIYLAWIINKGEFTSQYLEKFINDRFKSENFYTSIKNPRINFDKEEMRIIVDGENFNIFSIDEKKISEFKNLKVYINFLPLITKRKLVTNKIEMFEGKIESSSVFSEPLIINSIDLEGNLDLGDKEIIIDKFSTSIKEDFYQGTANLNLKDFKADGVLTKLLRKKIFYNLDLNSENMKFSLDKNSFSIEGDATLGETDVLLKGKKNYIDLSKFVSKYSLSGKIDENAIEKLFKLKATPYIKGPIDFNASYFIFKDNKERIKTSNNLKDVELKIPALNITKYKGTEATADIDFNFSNKKLKEIKIINYKQENKEMKGLVKLSKEFKPYKSLELDLKNNGKKTSIKIIKNKNLNTLDLKGDYLDFSETLKKTFIDEQKEDSFLVKLQPVKINLEAKEILVGEEKSIYKVDAILKYENKLFKEAKVYSKLKDEKEFSLTISPKENSRELCERQRGRKPRWLKMSRRYLP